MNNYSTTIHNHQKLEATQMVFSGWKGEHTVVRPCQGHHSVVKMNELLIQRMARACLKCILLRTEGAVSHTPHRSIHTTLGKRQNPRVREQVRDCQRLGAAGENSWVWELLCILSVSWRQTSLCVKTHRTVLPPQKRWILPYAKFLIK